MQVTKVPVSKPTVINVQIEKLKNIPIAEQVSKKIFVKQIFVKQILLRNRLF